MLQYVYIAISPVVYESSRAVYRVLECLLNATICVAISPVVYESSRAVYRVLECLLNATICVYSNLTSGV